MGLRVYFLIYYWGCNWGNFSKFCTRYYTSWYILCSRTFPLRTKNGGRVCYFCRIYSLIPSFHWINSTSTNSKSSIFCNVRRSKFNLFPSTFPRSCWDTTTLLRLPRCLYKMKCAFINRISNIIYCPNNICIYFMRSICLTAGSNCQTSHTSINGMIWRSPTWLS